ncbi:MAG: hypothetical protein R3A52_13090 [Polyangiales bacterium]
MTDPSPENAAPEGAAIDYASLPVAPAREPPPSGRRIALVLVGVTVALIVLCASCCLAYAFFIDYKAR